MRRLLLASITLLVPMLALGPAGATGQELPTSLSMEFSAPAALPRIGAWAALSGHWEAGFELESSFRQWESFPLQGPVVSDTDWRFAAGPSLRGRLLQVEALAGYGYGHLSWGQHRFPAVALPPMTPPGDARREWGLRLGFGLDWRFADHWSLGALHSARWLSGPREALGAPHRDPPSTALTLRLHW